jgi:hypothetical protein
LGFSDAKVWCIIRRQFEGDFMNDVDEFFTLRSRIVDLARTVEADPAHIGVLSTGEACSVAFLLGRCDLLPPDWRHPLDALERLGPKWEKAVRDLHRSGWRQ